MTFIKLFCPIAPHVCEEIWETLGGEGFCSLASWPEYDEAKTVDSSVEVAVQINGKLRATVSLPLNCDKDTAIATAKAEPKVADAIAGKTIVKEISVPNKIVNIVVK
jgi:leucyl-tRNA synthetase